MTGLGLWRPHHNTHAILVASITAHFGQAVNDIPWAKIVRDGRVAANKLGLQTENKLPPLAISIGPVPPSGPSPNVDGVEFLNVKRPDFYEEKITLQRNSIRYENWGYTRWNAFSDRAENLVSAVLDNYINSVPLLGIVVEYVDRFNGPKGELNIEAAPVIDPNSPLVAPKAFQVASPWHTHSGWFEFPDDITKRLVNADLEVGDSGPATVLAEQHRYIQIRTAMTDYFNQPGRAALDQANVGLEFLFHRCETLHDELKKILGVILTPEASARISLTPGNEP